MSTPRDRLVHAAAQPGFLPSGGADRGAESADRAEAVVPVMRRGRSGARLRPASRAGGPEPFTPLPEDSSNVQSTAGCSNRSALRIASLGGGP